jgi:hypothetical protein
MWYLVLEGECDMRVPQVSERIKEAPAQALRGVFAGIGQLLLVTDKIRNKPSADRDVPRARMPVTAPTVTDTTVTNPAGETVPAADAVSAPAGTQASTAQASTAQAATAETATAKPAAARRAPAKPATPKPATKPTTAKSATGRTTAEPAAAPAAAGAPKPPKPQGARDFDKTGNVRLLGDGEGGSVLDTAPPLPNYDELSVPSLRARLRNLDVAQVRQLADYERAHAARDDVLATFERRIAKLEAQSLEAGSPEAGA